MRLSTLIVAATAALASVITAAPHASAATVPARVVRWVDGDTVQTTLGIVRVIGIDTPERGACGYAAATAYANRLAPAGSAIRLGNPTSVQDADKYGRLLRFVNRGKRDIGAAQIVHGARARYDSRDGYQWHSRQARYHRLDARHANYKCASSGSSTGGASGAVAPSGKSCPSYAPIKGNASSMIYHRPGQQYYSVTVPEACFRTAASAEAAGYRPAKI
jgi:micrococcal nuclease